MVVSIKHPQPITAATDHAKIPSTQHVRDPRMFCVPRADITAADLAARFIRNLGAIAAAAQEPGPFIYSVQHSRIARLL
jgi:hypothetical protein